MAPSELQDAVASLRSEVAALRTEVAAMRVEMKPLLQWKAGAVALVGLVVTVGFLARAVEWILQLLHQK